MRVYSKNVSSENLRKGRIVGLFSFFCFYVFCKKIQCFKKVDMGGEVYATSRPKG